MIAALTWIADLMGTDLGLLLFRATALLMIAAVAARLARHATAALRHLIWSLALAGVIGIAVVSPFAPQLVVPIAVLPASVERALTVPAVDLSSGTSVLNSSARGFAINEAQPTRHSQPIPLLLVLWHLGALGLGLRSFRGHRHIRQALESTNFDDSDLEYHVRALSRDAGVRRTVRVVTNESIDTPLTYGWLRPIIALPVEAHEWSAERRTAVLLHELAHVARGDYVAQQVGALACTLFWFHPGSWLAADRQRAEGELAADDRVLASGMRDVSYAEHLLDLARHGRPSPAAAVAVGMARSSHIEGRLRAMLDTSRSHHPVTRRTRVAACAMAVVMIVTLAAVRGELRAVAAPVDEVGVVPSAVVDTIIDKRVAANSGGSLLVDLRTGGDVRVRGWDENSIRVVATLAGEDAAGTRVALTTSGQTARLDATFASDQRSRSTSHEFEIWVPRQTDIRFSSAGGAISVNDVQGEITGSTGGGEIHVAGSSGRVDLRSGGGNVVVRNGQLTGSVSTGGGRVDITNAGDVRGYTGNVQPLDEAVAVHDIARQRAMDAVEVRAARRDAERERRDVVVEASRARDIAVSDARRVRESVVRDLEAARDRPSRDVAREVERALEARSIQRRNSERDAAREVQEVVRARTINRQDVERAVTDARQDAVRARTTMNYQFGRNVHDSVRRNIEVVVPRPQIRYQVERRNAERDSVRATTTELRRITRDSGRARPDTLLARPTRIPQR